MALIGQWVFVPLAVLLLLLAFWEPARRRVLGCKGIQRLEKRLTLSERGYWAAFALILAAGVWVRCYRFTELPLGMNQDGTMAGVEAFCLLSGGTDQYGTSWPMYFEAWQFSQMSTLYSYLLIPFIKLLGLSKFSLRLPMLLMSLIALPLMWDAARRIAGKNYALAAMFLLALNPWHIVLSRWALEANMLPHVLLLAVDLLLAGMQKRWALYLSMVLFGLAPYAYGLAAVSVPFILLPAAVFLAARRKVKPLDLVICVAVFALVSAPYYVTMAINAFGLETMTLGRMTMPRFAESKRASDLALGAENPYLDMVQKLESFLPMATGYYRAEDYNGVGWANTMYPFIAPAALFGVYKLCRDRRKLALQKSEAPLRDGGMLILIWMFAAMVNTAMVGQPEQYSLLSADSLRGVCALADGQAAQNRAGGHGRHGCNRFCGHVRHLFRRCGLSICDGQLFPERIAGSAGRNVGLGLRSILSDDDGSQRRTKGDDGAGHVCPSYRLRHARGGGGASRPGRRAERMVLHGTVCASGFQRF